VKASVSVGVSVGTGEWLEVGNAGEACVGVSLGSVDTGGVLVGVSVTTALEEGLGVALESDATVGVPE